MFSQHLAVIVNISIVTGDTSDKINNQKYYSKSIIFLKKNNQIYFVKLKTICSTDVTKCHNAIFYSINPYASGLQPIIAGYHLTCVANSAFCEW